MVVGPLLVTLAAVSGLLLVYRQWTVRAHRRAHARMLAEGQLDGESTMRPAIASLEHLHDHEPEPVEDTSGSPYRTDEFDDPDEDRNRRARSALATARWLLISAVAEAEAADEEDALGRLQEAEVRRMTQHRAESEAVAGIFEAEDMLGSRIVRAPGEGRNVAPFYGRAAELLAKVEAFERSAFGEDES